MSIVILLLIFLFQLILTCALLAHIVLNQEKIENELYGFERNKIKSYRDKVNEAFETLHDSEETVLGKVAMYLMVLVLGIPLLIVWYFKEEYRNVGFGFFWPRKFKGVLTKYGRREYNSGYDITRPVNIKYPYIKIGCRVATIDRMKKIIIKEHGKNSPRAQAYLEIIKEYETGITQ